MNNPCGNPSGLLAQISKATTLQKTAEYISKMQQERAQLHEEAQRLREEIQMLNSAIKWVLYINITSAYCVHSFFECVSLSSLITYIWLDYSKWKLIKCNYRNLTSFRD